MNIQEIKTTLKYCENLLESVNCNREYQELKDSEQWHTPNNLCLIDAIQALYEVQGAIEKIEETRNKNDANIDHSLDYLTREFVRRDCGVHGANLTDSDCDIVIAEVKKLNEEGKFNHAGVYWIANCLAAEKKIKPTFSR